MRSRKKFGVLVILSMLSLGTLSAHAKATGKKKSTGTHLIAFLNATVVPMDRERVLNDHTVLLADGKITAIGPTSKIKVPVGAIRVDATLDDSDAGNDAQPA